MEATVSLAADLTARVMALGREEGELDFDQAVDLDLSIEELASLWLLTQSYRAAASRLEKIVRDELGKRLDGTVEVAGQLIYVKPKTRERCIDVESFMAWLAQNPDMISAVVNPNTVRKGSLPPVARETFFEKEKYGEPVAQAIPVELIGGKK